MNRITCFISYSHDPNNTWTFNKINNLINNSNRCINYTERENKSHFSDETIWDYLHSRISGSSCTILLLTEDLLTNNKAKISYVPNDFLNSGWIYNEISASLRDWKDNRINGLVCVLCDGLKFYNDPLNVGYKLPEILDANKEYIIFVTYDDFLKNHTYYINQAMINREKQIKNNTFNIKYDLHNGRKSNFYF